MKSLSWPRVFGPGFQIVGMIAQLRRNRVSEVNKGPVMILSVFACLKDDASESTQGFPSVWRPLRHRLNCRRDDPEHQALAQNSLGQHPSKSEVYAWPKQPVTQHRLGRLFLVKSLHTAIDQASSTDY